MNDAMYQSRQNSAPPPETPPQFSFKPDDVLQASLIVTEWNLVFAAVTDMQTRLGALSTKLREQLVAASQR